ncbi:hypothetical protein Pint_17092 [Pistacia integerrima]|uniref:Uncharacterized protein n=1 Tax=Pistacia integerrima TaxID=434235 RepID=A0ACC0Z9C1_9ROSI|nr:hypothetical protein Pint_17092 [Pistacia integerrima]
MTVTDQPLEDFYGELTKFTQTGTVCNYQAQFDRLLAQAESLLEQQQISCFVSGLKETIRADVRAANPQLFLMLLALHASMRPRSKLNEEIPCPLFSSCTEYQSQSWHSSTKSTPFEAVYGRPPPVLTFYEFGMAKDANVDKELR